MRRLPLLAFALLLLPSVEAGPGKPPDAPWADEAEAILAGVKEIASPGLPGAVAAWGPKAFPLVLGGAGGALRAPVVAAAPWGKGRVVLLSHEGYLGAGALAVADTGRFLENAVRWAGGAKREPRVGLSRGRLVPWFTGRGLAASPLEGAGWTTRLDGVDVLVWANPDLDEKERAALAEFVQRGGGLVAAQTPWGWMQIRRAEDLGENGLQTLLAPAGLGWTAATSEKTGSKGFLVAGVPGAVFHAERAVEALAEARDEVPKGLDARLASHVAAEAWRVLPADERDLRGRVRRLVRERGKAILPTATSPLKADKPLDRFLLAVQVMDLRAAGPKEAEAHPAAAAFPGAVPAGAKAVERRLDLDLAVPGWHGTGLYARPGVPVTLRLLPTTGGQGAERVPTLALRIGCHSDRLWHLDAWPRVPEITEERRAASGEAVLANPFGGLVYVVVPEGAKGRASVEVSGAVEAPRYVLGATTKDAWRTARRAPGPWAELETAKVILTVPSEHVRDLDDPEALLLWWDRVLDADADLAGIPRERTRAERIVADVEISAGYMHSGYPIMTHLDAAPRMVDLKHMSGEGDWGLFHELGHNHQHPDWTFDGTGEVTVNWFSLYVMEHIVRSPTVKSHGAFAAREKTTREHLARSEGKWQAWKSDPFLALFSYVDLIEAFGWEPLKEVIAEYRRLPDAERPKTDDQKRDQWLVRYSRRVGRNLGPHFERWGIPTSEAARASIRDLPPFEAPVPR